MNTSSIRTDTAPALADHFEAILKTKNGTPGWPGRRFPSYIGDGEDQFEFAGGFLAAGFRTGLFGAPFSFGRSSSLTFALSPWRKEVGSGSYETSVAVKRGPLFFSSFAACACPTT